MGRNGFASKFQSTWLLQYLVPTAQTAALASNSSLQCVQPLQSPPSVLQSSKSIQQAALSPWWVYIGILLVTTSTFYHGKREVLEAKFQKSSTCVIPQYNFSAIQRAMVMTFPAESGCQPRVGEALFLELSK